MTQTEQILACLRKGDATSAEILASTSIPPDSLSVALATLKKRGLVARRDSGSGRGVRATYCLAPAPEDHPAMIPGRPEAEPEFDEPFPPDDDPDAAEALADDEEPPWPPAHAIAHAVVAAARITGEDPLRLPEKEWLRCRFPAVKALRVFYPACDLERLGAYVGLIKLTEPMLRGTENARWWPVDGDRAYEAAVLALESC